MEHEGSVNCNAWRGVGPRKGLMDFHMPEFLPEVKINVEEYIQNLSLIGMETIIFVCKNAYGNCYYETKFGHKNIKVEGDLLKEIVSAAHKENIKVIAYYNVCCDDYDAVSNPDYCQRDAKGETITRWGYRCVCMNSPYREIAFAQLREIVEGYDVDGVFLDITYIFEEGCYCEYCRDLYKQLYGGEIPTKPEPRSPERENLLKFKRWIRFRFIRDAVSAIRWVRDLPVGWNHAGDPYFCQVEVDEYADYFSREFHSPNYLNGDLTAKWMRTFKKPFELLMPECYRGWGEWTILPSKTLKLMCTIALMNGGSPTIGHVAYPSGAYGGRVAQGVMDSIKETFNWVRQIEEPCSDAESIPHLALLHTVKNHRLKELLGWSPIESLEGAHHLLVENQVHFDIISQASREVLSRYEALVVPDEIHLSSDEVEAISEFVEKGGGLIASYRASLYDEGGSMNGSFDLGEVYGVEFYGFSPYSVNYLDDLEGEDEPDYPRMPLLVKGKALQVKIKGGAQVLASLTYPAVETKPYRHVYHQHAHPAVKTEFPAIVSNAYGKGRCVYIGLPIEEEFRGSRYYWLRMIYADALGRILPNPLLRVHGPLSLGVSLMRKGEKLLLHIIDYRYEKTGIVEEFPETRGVQVKMRISNPRRVVSHPQVREIEWIDRNGTIEFQVPPFKLYTAVIIS